MDLWQKREMANEATNVIKPTKCINNWPPMHLNVIQIDHKCNKTSKCSPTLIYPTERRLQNKPGKHKRRGALSKTISYCIYSKTRHFK